MAAALWRLHRLRAGRRGRCRSGSADTGGAGASCWRERAASLRLHWRFGAATYGASVLHVFVICNGAKLHLRHPSLGRRRVRCADSLSDAPATKNTHPLRPRCHRERRAPRAQSDTASSSTTLRSGWSRSHPSLAARQSLPLDQIALIPMLPPPPLLPPPPRCALLAAGCLQEGEPAFSSGAGGSLRVRCKPC